MNKEEQFLKIEFQQKLEEQDYLFNLPAPEERPYDNKYKAREILQNLLKNNFFNEDNEYNPNYKKICTAIIKFRLGENFSDTEENGLAEGFYRQSLEIFQSLDYEAIRPYFNYLQEIYNIYGLLSINREENEMGLSFLAKSKELYSNLMELPECKTTSKDHPLKKLVNITSKLTNTEEEKFAYVYEGGVCQYKTESIYTHTLFYLAQAYTKLGHRELAAQYCGETMKRQHATNTFELKDFCVNCISLAEYYQGIANFAQAQYLLLVGESLIPENKKRKLRASFQMSIGRMMLDLMTYNVKVLTSDSKDEEMTNFSKIINNKSLIFESVPSVPFPNLKPANNMDEIKSIFRQSNTQLKRALEYFKLDGYVTEHIQIVEDQSTLYKQLILLETSNSLVVAMLDKRAQLLEPIFNELNPKAYIETWQTLLVQLAEIYHDMFNINFNELFVDNTSNKPPKQSKIKEMNNQGEKCLVFFEKIATCLMEDKDATRDNSYYHSVVNAKFNNAKIYSKLYRAEKKDRIELLTKSLNTYKWISAYIRDEVGKVGALDGVFSQELKMCNEMVDLLPAKIDKIARA